MKILIVMNEFKGSLTSSELGIVIKNKINEKLPKVNVDAVCIADGGDGFLSLFHDFDKKTFEVISASKKKREAAYLVNEKKKQAVIEIAEIVGLKYLKEAEKNPYQTTTQGLGMLIAHLLDNGIREFIIGLGGSATNDCGIGMLSALGYNFFDFFGNRCEDGIDDLRKIAKIEFDEVHTNLKDAEFTIICDVENPLYGKDGATYIYSAQKGLDKNDFEKVDSYIYDFSKVVFNQLGKDYANIKGSGAAGGLGYAFMSFMNAKKLKGAEFAIDYLNLDKKLSEVDILITGEGKLDKQSFMGKAPIEVARVAKKHNKKVIFLAGSIFDDELEGLSPGEKSLIDASFSIQRGVIGLEEAIEKSRAIKNVERTVEQICSVLKFNYEKTK